MVISTRKKQRGQSMWGNLFMIIMLIFAAITVMKLWTPYYDNMAVGKALKNMGEDPSIRGASADQLRDSLNKRLSISGVSLSKEEVKVAKQEKGTKIDVNYERRVPMYGNIDAVVKFDHSLQLAPAQ